MRQEHTRQRWWAAGPALWGASDSGFAGSALGSGFLGFRVASRPGLALAWFRLDLASGFHLLGFELDLVGFGLIKV